MRPLVLLLLVSCARAPLIVPHRSPARATVLVNVRVFDGKSDALSGPVDVLVRDGRIATGPAPADAERIDGAGRTLLPGLYDGHVHLGGVEGEPPWDIGSHLPDVEAQAAALLWCGVTTVNLAGRDGDAHALSNDIAARRMAGPRLLSATRILTAVGGHPVPMFTAGVRWPVNELVIARGVAQVHGEDEARAAVRTDLGEGAHHVKAVYHSMPAQAPRLTREELSAAIDEAKKLGRPVFVHVGTSQGAVEAAQAGAAMLMHTPWEDELSPEQVQAIKASGTAVVTTRRIYSAFVNAMSGAPKFSAIERQVMRPGLERVFFEKPAKVELAGFEEYTLRSEEFDRHLGVNVLALWRAGVPLVAGTDTGIPGVFPGAGLHEELKALAALGIPPADVLRMATSTAARVLEPGGERGVIEPGAIADLVLVRGDPLADLAALDQIEGVWKRGERQR